MSESRIRTEQTDQVDGAWITSNDGGQLCLIAAANGAPDYVGVHMKNRNKVKLACYAMSFQDGKLMFQLPASDDGPVKIIPMEAVERLLRASGL